MNELALQLTGAPAPGASDLRALVRRRHVVPAVAARMCGGSVGVQEQAMFYTRGLTLHSTLDYLAHALPPSEYAEVLSRLSAEERAWLERASLTDDVPYSVALSLWRSADAALRLLDPQWVERAGAESIRIRGMQFYSGLLKKPTPVEFFAQHISLFQRYYRPGDMIITEKGAGRATARMVGFEAGDRLFCRRLTGGWLAGMQISGGREPTVSHARCVLEGDLFCEWEVRWK